MKIEIRTRGFEINELEKQFVRSTIASSTRYVERPIEQLHVSMTRRIGEGGIVECAVQATSREGWIVRREAQGENMTEALFEATARLERTLSSTGIIRGLDRERLFAA